MRGLPRVLLLRGLFLAVLLGSPAAATPAVAGAPPADEALVYQFASPDQALTFEGKGWGHGVGLCQWGARGRALAGQSSAQIVGAYYQGAAVQKASPPDTTIRVLLDSGRRAAPGEPQRVTAQDGRWQVETAGAPTLEAPAGTVLEVSNDGAGLRYATLAPDGRKLAEGALQAPLVLRALDEATRSVVQYKPAGSVPGQPGSAYNAYRGELILTPRADGVETANRLLLQEYLKGVVPAEMPSSWPVEAIRAQILVARTYAAWQTKGRASERYDVDDTTRFQVYLGANSERPNINQAIDATAGEVIVHRGQAIQAVFFSTCGGWTESNESVWPGPALPYLRGIQDVDAAGRPYDAGAPRASWATGALTATQLEGMLNDDPDTAIGRLLSLDLSRRAPSGRLLLVRATGSAGSKTFSPNVLQGRFNRLRPPGVQPLLSTNFDLQWTTTEAVTGTQGIQPRGGQSPGGPATPSGTPAPLPVPLPTAIPSTPPAPVPATVPVPPEAPTLYLEVTQPAAPRPGGGGNRYVSETGHNVGGAFLRFHDARGGLDVFGHPRTEEILEDGKMVQYFQRARFEHHPDKAGSPYEVQLTLLGDQLSAERRPFPGTAPFPSSDTQRYFPETGHSLSFGFLDFWRDRGGLDVFGYPISEELSEPNGDGSGRSYTVQYFQRARFEHHPELPGPYQVSLGLLGDQVLTQRRWLP